MSSNYTSFPCSTLIDYEKLNTYIEIISGKSDGLKEESIDNLMIDLEKILVDATKVKKSFDDLHQSKAVNDRKREHELKRAKNLEEPSETVSKKAKTVDTSLMCRFTPLKLKPKPLPEIFDDVKPVVTPYDTPKEFWKSVDPYCPVITPEFVQYLEQMTKPMDKNDEIFKIPELGQSYTEKWKTEDSKSDSVRTNRLDDSGDDMFLSNLYSNNMTQRLYGAMLEDPTHKTHNSALSQIASNNGKQERLTEGGGVVRLNKTSVDAFEQLLKSELAHQGILEMKKSKEDEIELEMRRCQQELMVLNESSCNIFQQLHQAATSRMKKEEKRNEAAQLATQLQKYYQRLTTNRQKKKMATKKEKSDLRSLLDQFEKISDEI